jgi:hypothetical protein
MMALANLLSHPSVGTERMSEPIGGRSLLRSAKDLGRVLALARFAAVEEIQGWSAAWEAALRATFPSEFQALAGRAGDGLRDLLGRPDALDDARHAVDVGLLAGYGVTAEELVGIAKQVIELALEPLAAHAREDAG